MQMRRNAVTRVRGNRTSFGKVRERADSARLKSQKKSKSKLKSYSYVVCHLLLSHFMYYISLIALVDLIEVITVLLTVLTKRLIVVFVEWNSTSIIK